MKEAAGLSPRAAGRLDLLFGRWGPGLPACCRNCYEFVHEREGPEDQSYCNIGVWLPVRKKTCRRQRPKQEAVPDAYD